MNQGSITVTLTLDDGKFRAALQDAEGNLKALAQSSEKQTEKASDSFGRFGVVVGAVAGIVQSVFTKAMRVVSNSINSAIRRVDTLNNFPKVMRNLGYSAEESSVAIDKLDKGVRGLPTSLDSIASAMQNIAPSTKSLSEATDLTLALNNALLAGGKASDVQASAMEQFSQAIARGKPDLIEWRSLATAMPGQMKQLANSLGYKQWQDMAQAVTDGTLSFDKVKESIVALNKEGLGKFPSFAEQAKNATGGLQTGLDLLGTAVTRGIGNVIKTLGTENINNVMASLARGFEGTLNAISSSISFFRQYKDVISQIATVIGVLLLPVVVRYISLQTLAGAQSLIAGAKMAAGWLLALGPIGLIASAAIAAISLIVMNWEFLTRFVSSVWKNIAKWGSETWDSIKRTFGSVGSWFRDVFNGAVNNIKNIFSPMVGWFSSLWGKIVSGFKNIGTRVGNAIGGAIRGVVNGIIKTVENALNTPIRLINGAINVLKNLPGLGTLGNIPTLNLPMLANGGIATSATIAMIGEGSESEAILPLSKLQGLIDMSGKSDNDKRPIEIKQENTIYSELDMNIVNRSLMREARRA